MSRKIVTGLAVLGMALAAVTVANAGEGHRSIGKGVQCRVVSLIPYVYACSSNRP